MKNELIHVSSKLMQNYHVGHPVSTGTQIATYRNSNGQVEVISIGSDFKLYNFYPDASPTGWAMKRIALPDNANAKEVVAGTQNNMPSLLVKIDKIIKGEGRLLVPLITLYRDGGPETPFDTVYLSKNTEGTYNGEPIYHTPVDPNSISLLSRQIPKIDQIDADCQLAYSGKGLTDNFIYTHQVHITYAPYQNTVTKFAHSSNDIYSSAILDYIDPKQTKKRLGTIVANVKPSTHPEDFNRVEFTSQATNNSRNFAQGNENTCSHVATTHLPNAAFAIRTKDKALVYLTSNESEFNGKYNLTVLSDIVGENGETIHQQMSQVYASTDIHKRPVAFTLDEEGYLYHSELKENGTWSTLGIVESHLKFKHLSISKNGLGNPIIFGVTITGQLWRVWLDHQIDLWQKKEIEIESSIKTERKAHELNTYSSEITVYDTAGLLRPNTKMKIWSSGSQNLIINGKGHITNKQHPVEVLSNDAAKVTIVTPTNDLATSIIHIWTEFMDDDKGVAIQANGDIQDKFSKITAEQLINAEGVDGKKLLQGDYSKTNAAQSMAEALNSSMAILEHSAKAYSKLKHASYSRVISGSKCHHVMSDSFGQRHRINTDQTYPENWKLSFESGLPVYSNLTNSEASHHFMRKDIDSLDMKAFGFFDYLSDVWRMVKEGFAKLVDIVINGIKAAVTVLIDGVKKIWRGVVNFVDEIFQAVLGFFESVKVFFIDLFHWLGTIFNWKNILLTKEAINYSFNTVLNFSKGPAIDYISERFNDKFSDLKSTVHNAIQAYNKSIGDANPLIDFEEKQKSQTSKLSSVEHNVMTNALMNNYKDSESTVQVGDESITAAFNKLKPMADSFSTSNHWDKAKAYFESIKSNPDNILELTMAGLLELVEVVTIWVADLLENALNAILDAISELINIIQDILNSSIYIPLVTEIYNLFKQDDQDDELKGLPFTYLDLVSLIIAMPTTVVQTLVTGQAPFTTDTSVKEFKDYFNVEWLNQKTGVTPHLKQSIAPKAANYISPRDFFNSLSGMTYAITAVVKPAVDITTVMHETLAGGTPAPIPLRVLSFVEAYLNTVGWIASTPWIAEKEDEYPTQGFEMLTKLWFIELFDDVILDWIFFVTDPEGKIESGVTTLFSAVNLVGYITLAAHDPARGFNVCKTLPGVFSIGRPLSAKLPKPYGPPIGAGVIAVIDIVSNGVMAGFSYDAVENKN